MQTSNFTAMTGTTTNRRIRFEELIEQAEAEIVRNPDAYKRKVAALAVLGYGYLFGILLITIGLIGVCILAATQSTFFAVLLIQKKLGILLIGVCYVLCKALWVRLDPPPGYRLNRKEFPVLFRKIDDLGKRLDAPKIHEIVITAEMNAGIQQTPRLGVFGWYKNTLILGLPLLLGLSTPQCMSVIAHEFGHLTGKHNRFNAWIYRVRMAWWRIMEAFDQAGGAAGIVFGRFFDWYAPYFNAYSFALARANEYEADAASARVTSNVVVAKALVQTNLLSTLLDTEFWENLEQRVASSAKAPDSIYTELKAFLEKDPFTREQRHATIKKLVRQKTGHVDTHPSLKDRVKALTDQVPVPRLPEVSAATALLGDRLGRLLKMFDSQWVEENSQSWRERYEYLRNSKKELSELEKKQKRTVLDNDERWKLAAWTEEFRPNTDPLPLYQSYWQDNQEDPAANYAVGRLMLDRGNGDGMIYLIKSMREHQAVIPACEIAFNFHSKQGNLAAAEEFRIKAEKQMDFYELAEAERATVSKQDSFERHDLEKEAIEGIRRKLQNIPKLESAWLCRKTLQFFQDDPAFVLIYKVGMFASDEKLGQNMIETLDLPGSLFLIQANTENRALTKKALPVAEKII